MKEYKFDDSDEIYKFNFEKLMQHLKSCNIQLSNIEKLDKYISYFNLVLE